MKRPSFLEAALALSRSWLSPTGPSASDAVWETAGMADAAGVVNRSGREHDTDFEDVIAGSSEPVQALARAIRDLVYDVLPETVEVVWKKQGSVGWGIGPKKFTEQFAYLMPYKNHVTLGFYRGGELPDPEGLLPTSGGSQVSGTLSMRSLKLTSLDDVRRPALRNLIAISTRTGI
ncbi:uncharacterized protein DUF1801 [Kribbella steppae]|uniref:Uncharacterized protein DUF1801 n=1 Tax=Kribbella steppae TaxID=2512223 RepID=A0A4R2GV49_9ACTN|nr:DUF1801 domain-containing protein [Kribbella steppae]TCO14364.1 uncharacterized protein DUF1801 [Kribbella steppae]